MSEGHGSNTTKGILNPSAGRFKPRANHTSRSRTVRSNSSSDRTQSPPPHTINTNPIPSNSLNAPPVVSVTAPTPQASPVSQKRAHHKSTPAYPSSALRPPTEIAPIQKSYSSGSASKRKADDVETDGPTPPREHRTTFAPEPRSKHIAPTPTTPFQLIILPVLFTFSTPCLRDLRFFPCAIFVPPPQATAYFFRISADVRKVRCPISDRR